jgi:hypothetical protein
MIVVTSPKGVKVSVTLVRFPQQEIACVNVALEPSGREYKSFLCQHFNFKLARFDTKQIKFYAFVQPLLDLKNTAEFWFSRLEFAS